MPTWGADFNPYAAGTKNYGLKGAPNIGPLDKLGYRERDLKRRQKLKQQEAVRRRLVEMYGYQ